MRIKCVLCCIIVLLAFALLAVALLMIFGTGASENFLHRTKQFGPGAENTSSTRQDYEVYVRTGQTHRPHLLDGKQRQQTPKHIATTKGPSRIWKPATVVGSTTRKMPITRKSKPTVTTTSTTSKTTTTTTVEKKVLSGPIHDCEYYRKAGEKSGTYQIVLPQGDFYASCVMESDQGWIVWQNRTSSKWPFWNNTFEEYAAGFGDFPGGEGWLGLNWVHALSEVGGKLEMRIRLDGDMCVTKTKRSCSGFGEGGSWWGDWEFVLSDRSDGFRISGLRYLRGNLSNNAQPDEELFSYLCDGQKFTTIDVDNDENNQNNCAAFKQRGAWWHSDCAHTSLNGRYGLTYPSSSGQFWNRKSATHGVTVQDTYIIKPRKSLILLRISDN